MDRDRQTERQTDREITLLIDKIRSDDIGIVCIYLYNHSEVHRVWDFQKAFHIFLRIK